MRAGRRAVDRALDLAVFGPLGFVLEARRLVPELAERGREHVDQRVRTLRAFGRGAVRVGRPPGRSAATSDQRGSARPAVELPDAMRGETTGFASDVDVRVVDELDVGGSDQAVIDEVNLPIEGYDALAASQIVARLGGLSAAELEQVQRYETAHRGRRTILHRTGQLLSGR